MGIPGADGIEDVPLDMRGVPIIEGLDLAAAEPGHYQLTCRPIRLTAAEAAPARVILTR